MPGQIAPLPQRSRLEPLYQQWPGADQVLSPRAAAATATTHECTFRQWRDPWTISAAGTTDQVENYDTGGEGVAYHDTTSAMGNMYRSMTWNQIVPTLEADTTWDRPPLEWLEYRSA